MGQEKLYMGQESLIGWDRRRQLDGTGEVNLMGLEKLIVHLNKSIFLQQMSDFNSTVDDCYQNSKVIITKDLR